MKSFIAVLFLVGCVVALGKDIWGFNSYYKNINDQAHCNLPLPQIYTNPTNPYGFTEKCWWYPLVANFYTKNPTEGDALSNIFQNAQNLVGTLGSGSIYSTGGLGALGPLQSSMQQYGNGATGGLNMLKAINEQCFLPVPLGYSYLANPYTQLMKCWWSPLISQLSEQGSTEGDAVSGVYDNTNQMAGALKTGQINSVEGQDILQMLKDSLEKVLNDDDLAEEGKAIVKGVNDLLDGVSSEKPEDSADPDS